MAAFKNKVLNCMDGHFGKLSFFPNNPPKEYCKSFADHASGIKRIRQPIPFQSESLQLLMRAAGVLLFFLFFVPLIISISRYLPRAKTAMMKFENG